jgi:ABC-type multidrug transport system ATPase subunit
MLISLKNINITIDSKTIIENFSLEIEKGEKIVIKGMSGKGKTTLINLLLGFIPCINGEYFFEGRQVTKFNISEIRKNFALLPQNLNFGNEEVIDFIKNIFNYNFNKAIKPDYDEIKLLADKLLLDNTVLKNNMSDISGGEKQRVAIICCLLLKRKIFLMDEPTSALDSVTKRVVMDLFFKNKEFTVISTSHDDEWAAGCNRSIQI